MFFRRNFIKFSIFLESFTRKLKLFKKNRFRFDTGKQAPFGTVDLDRYTTRAHISKWFGYVFTRQKFFELQSAPKRKDGLLGAEESFFVEPHEEFDTFIS